MNISAAPIFRLALTCTVLFAGFALPALAEDKVLLKTLWKQGKTYSFTQKMDQTMSMGEMGKTDMKMDMGYGMKTTPADVEGETKLAITFNKMDMVMNMNMAGQDIVIDTKDENNPQAKAMRDQFTPMMNAEIVGVIGKDGDLKEVAGLESLMANPQLKQLFSKEMFSQTMAQDKMYGFPKEPVGKGATWKMDHNMEMMGMQMKLTGDVAVEDISKVAGHDVATLHVKGIIKIDASGLMKAIKETTAKEGEPANPALDEMKPEIKDIKIDMKVKFDATDSMSTSASGTTDVDMSMKIPGGEKMNMKMKQKIETALKMEDTK